MLGFNAIGATVDTLNHPIHISYPSIPPTSRIISLCNTTFENNIILIGFD
jgi:hypothetical protein